MVEDLNEGNWWSEGVNLGGAGEPGGQTCSGDSLDT